MRPCRNEFEPDVGFVVMAVRNAAIRVEGDDAGTSRTRPPVGHHVVLALDPHLAGGLRGGHRPAAIRSA